MDKKIVIICLLLLSFSSKAQLKDDSSSYDLKKLNLFSISSASVWSGTLIGLNQLWYKDYPKSSFHFFDDSKEWLQMDKVGHAYSAYQLSKISRLGYKFSGLSPKKAIIYGGIVGWGYLLSIEFLDAYNKEWGFSFSDVVANTFGSGFFISQQLIFGREILLPKFSFYKSSYTSYRPNVLGKTYAEQFFKDYNGQNYWLSLSLGEINNKLPKWLGLSFGYSVNGKIHAKDDVYISSNPINQSFKIYAKREFLISLDLLLNKIEVDNKFVKSLFEITSCIKFPFPTFGIVGNQFQYVGFR